MLDYQISKRLNIFWIILTIVLILIIIFLGYRYSNIKTELIETQANVDSQVFNNKVLDFTNLFIESVLQSNEEVDFETRLKLEGSVRDLSDEEILVAWNRFVNAPDNNSAQKEVKELLALLVDKINN
jgi:hypothetical protein